MKTIRKYQAQTAAATLRLIAADVDPWLALGQFIDDWRGMAPAEQPGLIAEAPPDVSTEYLRWAALLAVAVDWLSAQSQLPSPPWTSRNEYRLTEPWFLYPGGVCAPGNWQRHRFRSECATSLVGTAFWRASSSRHPGLRVALGLIR